MHVCSQKAYPLPRFWGGEKELQSHSKIHKKMSSKALAAGRTESEGDFCEADGRIAICLASVVSSTRRRTLNAD